MFEGIVLIIFFIIGGLTTLLALFFFVIAIIRQSKPLFKFGMLITIVPLSLYGLTYWFYHIHIPDLNKQAEQAYAGIYVMITSDSTGITNSTFKESPQLILNVDNTFHLDRNDFTSFYGKGTWKAGATDEGQFEFKDSINFVIFWAMPSNHNRLEINRDINDRRRLVFVK